MQPMWVWSMQVDQAPTRNDVFPGGSKIDYSSLKEVNNVCRKNMYSKKIEINYGTI